MDFDRVREQAAEGYISIQKHPSEDLYIYNYTAKAQWERNWTPETLGCRGLIADGRDRIVANPFPKFFNYEELSRSDITLTKPFTVTAKLDGSLGILYRTSGPKTWRHADGSVRVDHMDSAPGDYYGTKESIAIATRGSFVSDQAVRATKMLQEKYPDFSPADNLTYLFEIIYPENRIVVDYEGLEDILLLAVRVTETGEEVWHGSPTDALWLGWRGSVTPSYELPEWYTLAEGKSRPKFGKMDWFDAFGIAKDGSEEGLVFRFETKDGHTRVKMKVEEYKRLHKLMTGTSNKTVWEYLSRGTTLELLLDAVPDEFYDWVRGVAQELKDAYQVIAQDAVREYDRIRVELYDAGLNEKMNRPEFAERAKLYKYPGILFSLLDNNNDRFEDSIWKLVKPAYAKPFANEA